jgi:hypothetical protein
MLKNQYIFSYMLTVQLRLRDHLQYNIIFIHGMFIFYLAILNIPQTYLKDTINIADVANPTIISIQIAVSTCSKIK